MLIIDGFKRFFTGYLLSVCFGAAALLCLYVSTRMSQYSSITQASTQDGKELMGWAAIIIHVVCLGPFSIAANQAFKRGRKHLGWGLAAVVVVGAMFSGMNILGFLASEKMSSTMNRQLQIEERSQDREARRIAEIKRLELQAKLAEKKLEWDAKTGVPTGKSVSRAERNDIRKQNADSTAKLMAELGKGAAARSPDTSEPTLTVPDGGSELMSSITWGMLSVGGAQTLHLALFMILLLAIEPVLWAMSSNFWGWGAPVGPSFVTQDRTLPLGEEAHVTVIPPPEPPAGQRMLPAPLSRPEPAADGRAILVRIGFPKAPPLEKQEKEGRDVLGLRFLAWLMANAIAGTFEHSAMTQLYREYCEAQNMEPWADRVAKAELAAIRRGRRQYAWGDGNPVVWTIQLPSSFDEMNQLLDKAGFPAAPKPGRVKAEKADPTKTQQPPAEEVAPEGADNVLRPGPFVGSAEAPPKKAAPVKGMAELQRGFIPNIDAMRLLERANKKLWQARMIVPNRKSLNRFSRARSVA